MGTTPLAGTLVESVRRLPTDEDLDWCLRLVSAGRWRGWIADATDAGLALIDGSRLSWGEPPFTYAVEQR